MPTRRRLLTDAAAVVGMMAELSRPGRSLAWVHGAAAAGLAPSNNVLPSINRAYVNSMTTCTPGSWGGAQPMWFSFQAIVGGTYTGPDYQNFMPLIGNNGATLQYKVTAWNIYGSATAYSNTITITNPTRTTVTDWTSFNAAIASPPANGLIFMQAGNYAGLTIQNKNFSPPLIATGDPTPGATYCQCLDVFNSNNVTVENLTATGVDSSSFGFAVSICNGCTVTLNNCKVNTGQPLGTLTGPYVGFGCQNNANSTITFNGSCSFSNPDNWGYGHGMSFTDNVSTTQINVNGMTIRNLEEHAFVVLGTYNIAFDRLLVCDTFWSGMDHPDGVHIDKSYSGSGDISVNVSVTNSGFFQNQGYGSQNHFVAGQANTIYTCVNNWVFQGLGNLSQSFANMNLGGVVSAEVVENFFQGWGASGGQIGLSNSSQAVSLINNTREGVAADAGSVWTETGATVISQASGSADYTTIDPWLATPKHAMARARS